MTNLLDSFESMLNYTHWANERIRLTLQASPTRLPQADQWFAHMLVAHRIWLERIQTGTSALLPWDPLHQSDWENAGLANYTDTLTLLHTDSLAREVTYHNSAGQAFGHTVGQLLWHVCNHHTHHRGQIAALLSRHGATPPATDYIFFLRDEL